MLAKIINYQGQRSPIVVSKRSGFITKGHGRLMALQLLGWDKAAVDYQDYEDEAQEMADMVADNKIAELAETDVEMLNEIGVILGDSFDHELLGLEEKLELLSDETPGCDEDEVPEVTNSISKLGDVYELGEHRLVCGDSTDKATVELLMTGEEADMVFTDPPYRQSASVGGFLDEGRESRKKLRDSNLNEFEPAGFYSVLSMLNAPTIYAFCSKNLLRDYIESYMKISSPERGSVLDLFGGSGSTLIACEKTKRKCYMMELDEHYISVIIERWMKYTGRNDVYLLNKDGSKTIWSDVCAKRRKET
jgi:16S rRNA G966 N2-methylase RsmD